MAIPNFDGCMYPLLRVLAKHPDGLRTREAIDLTADDLGISPEERRLMLPSGNDVVYRNRIAWAHHHLKAAGVSASPRWGTWKITEAGCRFLQAHPDGIDLPALKKLMEPGYKAKDVDDGSASPKPERAERAKAAGRQPIDLVHERTPDERIGDALREIQGGVSQELLELLAKGTPEFFEQVVLDVLQAMGYGARGGEITHVGGVGDGGIDGLITLDRLGLQKVGVQAKRWQGSVGGAEVQAFYGALAQRRAHHGVMITTSTFSKAAIGFAEQVSDKIVLVDGAMLARHMIEHGVGVSHRELRVPKIDRDYFEDA
jgi:restriction system protein